MIVLQRKWGTRPIRVVPPFRYVVLALDGRHRDFGPVVAPNDTAAVTQRDVLPSAGFNIRFVGRVDRNGEAEFGTRINLIQADFRPRNRDLVGGSFIIVIADDLALAGEFLRRSDELPR